jgi:hypothetical protein
LKQKHRKPWVRINLVKGESLEANLPKYVAQLETLNPLLGLDEIAWGARAATVAGISGSQNAHTTVYAVTVDLQSALRRARGPNKTAFLAAVASRLSPAARLRLKNSSLLARLEAWVQQGRVVRLSMEALPGVHIAALTAFREVRTPVVIHAPPPNQSTDVAKLGPAGERESTGGGDSDGA